MSGIADLFTQIKKEIKTSTGTDYTATVTRVEGNTAYVRLTGSDISDTPATLSVDAKPGDKVRVRVRNGGAWVTGNDTLPPSNDKKEVATKMSKDMSNKDKHIIIRDGIMKFIANTLCIDSTNFKLDENGNAEFSGALKAATGTFSGALQAATGTFSGALQAATGTFKGSLQAATGTFKGTLTGAKYVDSTSKFSMDIGSQQSSSGAVSPAFNIGGHVNGDTSKDYMEVLMTLLPKSTGEDLPHLQIAGNVKKNASDSNPYGVSIQLNNGGIYFYGSWVENNRPYRVTTFLPWSYNPLTQVTDGGYITGSQITSHNYQDYTEYFTSTYTSAPDVVACLAGSSDGSEAQWGSCSCSVHSITTSQFKVRVYNNTSVSLAPNIRWIAVGQ